MVSNICVPPYLLWLIYFLLTLSKYDTEQGGGGSLSSRPRHMVRKKTNFCTLFDKFKENLKIISFY